MKKLKTLLVDDEPIARQGLKEYLRKTPFLELSAEFESPVPVLDFLHRNHADLLFLDIQMPGLSGIEFLKILPSKPSVIICSAYPEHAIEGFELDVCDYLLKPFSYERFLKAAYKVYSTKHKSIENETDLFLKCEGRYDKVRKSDIRYVIAMQNYVCVYTEKSRFITHLPMKTLEEALGEEHFIRIHKSYLINLDHLDYVEGNEIVCAQQRLPISRNYREHLMQKISPLRVYK